MQLPFAQWLESLRSWRTKIRLPATTPVVEPWVLGLIVLGFLCFSLGTWLTYQAWWEERKFQVLPVEPVWQKTVSKSADATVNQAPDMVIAVLGAVSKPGVYRLSPDSRVHDAILAAGGFSEKILDSRNWQCLQLAQRLQDGQTIFVPGKGEPCTATGSETQKPHIEPLQKTDPLEFFNTATLSALEALPHIGAAKAAALEKGRPFADLIAVREILSVSEKQWGDLMSYDAF